MGKIAFLFLVISNLHFPSYWHDFFKGHEDQYSIYTHAKEDIPDNSFLKKHQVPTVPSSRARTMFAQRALLKIALDNPENEKFIFVSESTIPLQDFQQIYETLLGTNKSIFYFMPSPHANTNVFLPHKTDTRNLKPIPEEKQYKNSQWVVLNRNHAQLIVEDTTYLQQIMKYPCDQECYPSTLLALHNLLYTEVLPQDTTYMGWYTDTKQPPYTCTNFASDTDMTVFTNAMQCGYLFFRKIAKDCQNMNLIDPILPYKKIVQQDEQLNQPAKTIEFIDAQDAITLLGE